MRPGEKVEKEKGEFQAGRPTLLAFPLFAFIPLLLALLFSAVLVIPVSAQGPAVREPTADEVNRIAKQLYCPVCPNTPLDVCETKACEDWRALIRDKLAAGESEGAIIDYFVAQYGTRVLAAPPRRGLTLLIWLIPPLGLLAGGWLFWRLLQRPRSAANLSPADTSGSRSTSLNHREPPPIPAEYLARLEEDVRKG